VDDISGRRLVISRRGAHASAPTRTPKRELLRGPASTLQDAVHNCSWPSDGIPLKNRQSKCPP